MAGTENTPLLRSPRLWSVTLTIAGTLLALMVIWSVIDLNPGVLTAQIKSGTPIQIGTWLALAGLAAYGVFAAVRYLTSTLVASFAGRRHFMEPVLGLAAYTLFAAGIITGHLFEFGLIGLVVAMAARYVVRTIRSVPVSAV